MDNQLDTHNIVQEGCHIAYVGAVPYLVVQTYVGAVRYLV